MKDVNYVVPVLVSGFFTLLLVVFYYYKSGNSTVMHLLATGFMKTRYRRAQIQKDTRGQDTVLLIVLVILIMAFGFKIIYFAVVISDSMVPQFHRGDLILSQTVSKDPQIGDIITFKASGVQNPVTHRVVDVQGNIVTTKGDNNPLKDDYGTTKKDILAKAITIEGKPIVIKGVGSYFILDFSKEGKLYKYGDQYEFLQQLFLTIRTWGYVITIIAFAALIMSMAGSRR